MSDPYEVLGVARNASAKDIKAAFRKLAKKHHPDQNPDDPKAKERFAAANQAYEILGDEKKKAAFDRGEIDAEGKQRFHGFEGAAGGDPFGGFRRQQGGPGASHFEFRSSGPGGFDTGDIFSQIFGDAFGQRGGGHGAAGPGAGGHGAGMGGQRAQPGADVNVNLDVTIEEAATAPKVTALFPDGRKIAVKLPDFVEDGQTIRLKGQGEQGFGGPGDALVKIRFRRHPRYRVEGRDLHADLPVTLHDAVLGTKATVETPTGRIAVKVPEWSSSDKVLRIKGRGLPEKAGGHGDLYVHVRVMLPEGGNPALAEFVRKSSG
ncbi:DnaJ C-terminal domain-containing protein [Aminobacter sp. Piv2-1]|uniref:DnaJ C-terminal domain-containing protein n=1 Tax=Aminobacter sp. Piv2-1 TaxID=3031122 RepID=UPI0030A2FF28